MKDVVIAGAGPAGIACAVALVRRDRSLRGRLLVLDRARFPRDKPCGGGLTGHVASAMTSLGLELAVPSESAPRARVRFGALGREVRLAQPVRIVRRDQFDASLVEQARALGIEVRENAALEHFRVTASGVELTVSGESLRTQILVGADGAGSQLRKFLHRGRPRETPIRLFRLEVPGARHWPRDLMLYDFSPMLEGLRGYLWIFPSPEGRLNVGLMHDPSAPLSGAQLTTLLGRHLTAHGITLDRPARGWPAWGYSPSAPVADERLLLVGDAAGVDGLTGEGIAVGFEQGLVAAGSICAALDSGDFRLRDYAPSLRRATVGRELTLDRRLAWLLYRHDWRRWLSLVLFDDRMLELYAARVSGSLVLADHKRELASALARHLWKGGSRKRRLSISGSSPMPTSA